MILVPIKVKKTDLKQIRSWLHFNYFRVPNAQYCRMLDLCDDLEKIIKEGGNTLGICLDNDDFRL